LGRKKDRARVWAGLGNGLGLNWVGLGESI